MDPLNNLSLDQDTTIGFINRATERGHSLYICTLSDLSVVDAQTWAHAHPITVPQKDHVDLEEPVEISLASMDCVWMFL